MIPQTHPLDIDLRRSRPLRRLWLVPGRWVHRTTEEPEDGHQETVR